MSRASVGPKGRREGRPRVLGRESGLKHISPESLPPAVNGVLAGLFTFLLTFGALLTVASLGWVFAADHTSLRGMFAFTSYTWLAAHLLPVDTVTGSWWLPPLLLTAGVVAVSALAGSEAVQRGLPRQRQVLLTFAGAAVGTYAVLGVLVAAVSASADTSVALWRVVPALALVMGLGLAAGVARELGLVADTWRRVPARLQHELRAAGTGLLVMCVGAGVLLLAATVTSFGRLQEAFTYVRPGWSGTALMILICLVYLPTALVWAASFSVGAGFSIGSDTVYAPWQVASAAVPDVPLLEIAPVTHSWWYLLVFLVPLAAGVAARRALPAAHLATAGLNREVLLGMARTAGFAALATGVMALLSDGGIGGRLAQMGPPPLLVMGLTGAWFMLAFALVEGWHLARQRSPLHRRRARPQSDEAPEAADVRIEQ